MRANGYFLGTGLRSGDGLFHALLNGVNEVGDLFSGFADPLGQVANLIGHDGEPTALLAVSGGLDGGVERQEVGLGGDVLDDREDLADLGGLLTEPSNLL